MLEGYLTVRKLEAEEGKSHGSAIFEMVVRRVADKGVVLVVEKIHVFIKCRPVASTVPSE